MVFGSPEGCERCGKTVHSCVSPVLCFGCEDNYERCEYTVSVKGKPTICKLCDGQGWVLKQSKCKLCDQKASHSVLLNSGHRFPLCPDHVQEAKDDGLIQTKPEPIPKRKKRSGNADVQG